MKSYDELKEKFLSFKKVLEEMDFDGITDEFVVLDIGIKVDGKVACVTYDDMDVWVEEKADGSIVVDPLVDIYDPDDEESETFNFAEEC